MVIDLYINASEQQAIHKILQNELELNGTLRNESSVINPSFIMEHTNPSQFNYCFIPEFDRYYFIKDIVSVRNNLWRIDCDVDVLMSFQSQILDLDVIVSDETTGDISNYMSGNVWQTTVKTKTDVVHFPYGLLEQGEYILITSGGTVTSPSV